MHGLVDLAGEIDLRAVRKVATVRETHAENGIAGGDQPHVHGRIGLRTGVRLHVGPVSTEQLAGTLDSQLLDHVDVLAPAVISLADIAFGILVGEHGALRLHDARAGIVLRCDELDMIFLPSPLRFERFR